MISNVIRQTDNNFIFLESSHSETTASGKSVEVTSHSSQMEPHQVDNVSSPSQDPSTPTPKDLTTHHEHDDTSLVTEGYGPPGALQETRSTSTIASPTEIPSEHYFVSQTDKGK